MALRRKCASAIWAVVPKSIGRVYFGSVSLWPGNQGPSTIAVDLEARQSQGGKSASGNHGVLDGGPTADEHKDAQASRDGRIPEGLDKSSNHGSTPSRGSENIHTNISDERPDPEEERILAEIESGILDVFSDAYCNKHLIYGMLELILVRLMPELTEKGIIELWEERLD